MQESADQRGSTITNARTGQRMRAEVMAPDVLRIECWSPPSPAREPEHTHPTQESRFEILDGELVFEVEGSSQTVVAPGSFTIPAGSRHRFWNGATREAHYYQEFRPSLGMWVFFETLFRLSNEGRLDANGMPSLLDIPAMVDASADVVRPTSPPWFLLRLTAALLKPVASLRGRSRSAAA